ncbi:SDR family oxidoreductase [Planctomonas sp. JC2975]|uniref:NAD(P)H-binding protein n=1 Tax=Planctomonas sp. JC2975 TaxID=2729626 RepID=UPI001473B300|nr:SDR family oxidoreductase [Planctomonas sp. JC2975]
MNIVVFGANGPTGRLVVRLALERGHAVTAVTRNPGFFPFGDARLRVVAGDVLEPETIRPLLAGQDAVLSALGVPYSKEEIATYSSGGRSMIDAMHEHGVRRLVCVSSSAVDLAAGPHGGFFFERVLQPFVTNVLGKTLYDDMKRMERIVVASDIDWTVMRPSGLFDADAVSDYRAAERYVPQKFTSRIDLADAMVRQLDDRGFVRTTVAVGTVAGTPSVAQLMMREAFKRPPRPAEPGAPAVESRGGAASRSATGKEATE